MHISEASISDEILVVPIRALRKGEEAYAVCFAVRSDDEGIKQVVHFHNARKRDHYQRGFEYGYTDSHVIFDDCFVSWERVFLCGETLYGGVAALLFALFHRHSYSGCKPAMLDYVIGLSALAAEINSIEKTPHVREILSKLIMTGELGYAAGYTASALGKAEVYMPGVGFVPYGPGSCIPHSIYCNVGRCLSGEAVFHEQEMLCNIAGGLPATFPYEKDLANPETRALRRSTSTVTRACRSGTDQVLAELYRLHHFRFLRVDALRRLPRGRFPGHGANRHHHPVHIYQGGVCFMKIDDIKKICVVGAGNMGHQISLQAALSGYRVSCVDISEEQLAKARIFTESYLPGRVAKGKLTEDQASAAMANLSFTTDLKEAARDADFVIEAAAEILEIKKKIFGQLDEICPAHTILATNSSFLVSSLVAGSTRRPEKVCNMHFFNPALVMRCVEVVKGPHTSAETTQVTMELSKRLQKIPVLLHKEISGFLVNRILAAVKKEVFFLYDMGVASCEDIDSAVVNALGHPMGPFRLQDLTGIDLTYHISMERYQKTGNPEDRPSPVIVEKYFKGEWGEKTGKGFYEYKK